MGFVKQSADLMYTFRILKVITTKWEEFDAYKLGLIDDKGNRIRSEKLDSSEKKDAYTTFLRLAFNLKRIIEKAPGGSSRLGSFAAALYLIKESQGLSDKNLRRIFESSDMDPIELLNEGQEWFELPDGSLSPGVYRIKEAKIVNSTYEELAKRKDQIRIHENSKPIGNLLGLNLYEATHIRSGQPIYLSVQELIR